MKRFLYLLAVVAFLMACEKDTILGGLIYSNIFITTEEGLVAAHDHVLTYPYSAVSDEIEIVSNGMNEDCVRVVEDAAGITIDKGKGFPFSEENRHPAKYSYYVQSLKIKFQPNLTRQDRVLKVEVHTVNMCAAEITIIQQGRQ